jgi:hypothetical protein
MGGSSAVEMVVVAEVQTKWQKIKLEEMQLSKSCKR